MNDNTNLISDTHAQNNQEKIEKFFSRALASTIMSVFPVVSVVALFKSRSLLLDIVDLIAFYPSQGVAIPGKLRAAKILATVGKFAGLGCTIYYTVSLAWTSLWFFLSSFIFSTDSFLIRFFG